MRYALKTMLLSLFVFCCVIVASGQTNKDTIKKHITLLNQQLEDDFNKNDMTAVAAFYSDDSEIVYDNYVVKGRKNLDNYWMNMKDKGRAMTLVVAANLFIN